MIVGKRQRSTQGWGRLALLSLSAIALALALFPGFAHAECTTSSCIQYSESLPDAGGGDSPRHDKQTAANASKSGGQTGSDEQGSKGAGSSEGESSKGGLGGHGQEGGPPQGNADGSDHSRSDAGAPSGSRHKPDAASPQSSGGGSSPLVPILIAIAILAAISVAAVMYRQRRQRRGPGTSTSPEAG
jgi:hypothetical protein